DKGVQRTFCSTQEFLDEDAATRFAKTVLIHHLINYRPRCGKITCNDHALTESKPVCFYNNWKSRSLAKPKRVIAPFKCPRVCSWNPLLAHQFLRKNLRGLELRGHLGRPENAQAFGGKKIDHPVGEWIVRTNHC